MLWIILQGYPRYVTAIPTPTQVRGYHRQVTEAEMQALREKVVRMLSGLKSQNTVSVDLGVLNRDFSVLGLRQLRTELKRAGWETATIGLRDNIFVLRIAEFREFL